MITKYGYRIINKEQLSTLETWGFETKEEMMVDMEKQWANEKADCQIQLFETLHRSYFGKQFKQVACKRIN